MADRVRSLDISGPLLGSCNSNSCMKLSFEGLEMSIRRLLTKRKMPCGEWEAGGQCGPTEAQSRGAPHELRYVRKAKGMAGPRAGIHEDACPPRGADLRQAGCGGPALEGDPDPRGTKVEGEGREPLEHVHAAERA